VTLALAFLALCVLCTLCYCAGALVERAWWREKCRECQQDVRKSREV
jgi:Na+-transporting methylmalonyl-CoA/oxaloacetate decarboxylase gamma subunit